MTASPPRFSAWALGALLPADDREAVLGDLWEEFHAHVVPARGARAARWWYRRQVATSVAPFIGRAWSTATLGRVSLAAAIVLMALLPACALVVLRGFVLSQVPLKANAEPSLLFLAVLAACGGTSLVAGACGAIHLLSSSAGRAADRD